MPQGPCTFPRGFAVPRADLVPSVLQVTGPQLCPNAARRRCTLGVRSQPPPPAPCPHPASHGGPRLSARSLILPGCLFLTRFCRACGGRSPPCPVCVPWRCGWHADLVPALCGVPHGKNLGPREGERPRPPTAPLACTWLKIPLKGWAQVLNQSCHVPLIAPPLRRGCR